MADQPLQVNTSEEFNPAPLEVLQHDKIFLIQVGYKLFRMSGLSLSSDAPSYFTQFFLLPENEDKVLFIDRDPKIFERIYNHLQGYALNLDSAYEMVNVWSDSYYFGLKRLQLILIEGDVFAVVGNQSFKICRKLLQGTGNTPNFFTVNYDNLLVDSVSVIERKRMLRPPPQYPAMIPNRSPKLFADLLEILLGNHIVIENDSHRQLLIRECKYYRFLELEQRIIKYKIINNPFMDQEILINLNDLQYRGVSNDSPQDKLVEVPLKYTRPYIVKEPKRNLLLQIDSNFDLLNLSSSHVKLVFNKSIQIATVHVTNKHCKKLLAILKDYSPDLLTEDLDTDLPKLIFPVGLSECKAIINGMEMKPTWAYDMLGVEEDEVFKVDPKQDETNNKQPATKKRRRSKKMDGDFMEFMINLSVWRIMMRGDLVRLHGVLIHGFTNQGAYIKDNIELL